MASGSKQSLKQRRSQNAGLLYSSGYNTSGISNKCTCLASTERTAQIYPTLPPLRMLRCASSTCHRIYQRQVTTNIVRVTWLSWRTNFDLQRHLTLWRVYALTFALTRSPTASRLLILQVKSKTREHGRPRAISTTEYGRQNGSTGIPAMHY